MVMRRTKVILLTGFEPFGGSEVNPSILACRRLDGRRFHGYTVRVEEIPLRFAEIKATIEGMIEKHRPSAVICTGQSGGAYVALERVAINVADARRVAYNCGTKPQDQRLSGDGPAAYFTGLPVRRLLERLRDEKIPAEISNSAGTFGCNQIFYHLMDYVEGRRLGVPAGFIHVPPLPEQVYDKQSPSMSLETTARALEVIVEDIASNL